MKQINLTEEGSYNMTGDFLEDGHAIRKLLNDEASEIKHIANGFRTTRQHEMASELYEIASRLKDLSGNVNQLLSNQVNCLLEESKKSLAGVFEMVLSNIEK